MNEEKAIEDSLEGCLKQELFLLVNYIKECRWAIAISNIFFLCIYGTWLFNVNPRLDTNAMINLPDTEYNWKEIGRQGLLFTEKIWGITKYNPYIYTFFGFVLVAVGATLFGYLFWRAGHGKKLFFATFVVIAFLHPILTEQFYFDLQLFQVGWAYVLTAASCGLAHWSITRKSPLAGLVSVILAIWSFSSYQAFVFIYIETVIAIYLLYFRRYMGEEKAEYRLNWLWYIGWHVVLFLVGFFLNFGITKLWFTSSDYLGGQVLWGVWNKGQLVDMVKRDLAIEILGDGVFYSQCYVLIAVFVFITLLVDLIGKKTDLIPKGMYILAYLVLQICPFFLTIYLGHAPVVHAQLAYPFVWGVDLLLLLTHSYKTNWCCVLASFFSIAMIWSQVQIVERLVYTDYIRAQGDIHLAMDIQQAVNASSPNAKVAFVGEYSGALNNSCQIGDKIGLSVFNVNRDVGTKYWNSTCLVCDCFQTYGYTLFPIPEEKMMDARVLAADMPSWPESGSIKKADDYIIVKFSDDEWPEEVNQYAPGTYLQEFVVSVSRDCASMDIKLFNHEDMDAVVFAVWSEKDDQDDLSWYQAVKQADGSWAYTVDLEKHHSKGKYNVHVYEENGTERTLIQKTDVYVEAAYNK